MDEYPSLVRIHAGEKATAYGITPDNDAMTLTQCGSGDFLTSAVGLTISGVIASSLLLAF